MRLARVSAVADQVGAGSVLAVGIVGVLLAMVVTTLPLYIGMASRQAVIGAADAAALAAADVAVGIVPGVPCTVAGTVTAANGASLADCSVDGLVVTVHAERTYLGFMLGASATAGPPDG